MKVLVIDVGGASVKLRVSDVPERRRFPSGPLLTPVEMVRQVKAICRDWPYDVISLGYPGRVQHGRVAAEPHNLGEGWTNFDFASAFDCPVKLINDAAMQALGNDEGGRLLFLGLGTGLGSAMVVDGRVLSMELAHLPYRKGRSYEDYVGAAGLHRLGKKKWNKHVWAVVDLLRAALEPDVVVVGGGNAKKLKQAPEGVRLGENASAFVGGFRLWQTDEERSRAYQTQ